MNLSEPGAVDPYTYILENENETFKIHSLGEGGERCALQGVGTFLVDIKRSINE